MPLYRLLKNYKSRTSGSRSKMKGSESRNESLKNISGIPLAAGLSQRMGQLKAPLEWEGKPLIKYQVEKMKLAGVPHIHVGIGHCKADIEKHFVQEVA